MGQHTEEQGQFFNTAGMGNSIVGGIAQGGMNILNSWLSNKWAGQREATAREENYKYGEQAANAADARTRALYNDLYSPQAQMQQIKDAGLSPSIYASGGISGKSGTSGAMGTGASGVSPQTFGVAPVSALEAAQIGLINAQTRNVDKDTENKDTENQLLGAQIDNVLKDTEYKEVGKKALEISNELQNLQLTIEKFKYDEGFTFERIEYEASKLYYESLMTEENYKIVQTNAKLAKETLEYNIKIVAQSYENLVKEGVLKTAQINLTNEQCNKLINDMLVDWFNAEVYKLSEQAKVVHMGNQLKLEYKKLGANLTTAQYETVTKLLTGCISALGNLTAATIISKGGIKLTDAKQTPKPVTDTSQPSQPYN